MKIVLIEVDHNTREINSIDCMFDCQTFFCFNCDCELYYDFLNKCQWCKNGNK